MPILDFLFGEQPEYYQLPWQTYGQQAYKEYGLETNQAFYDWADQYNQQAADLYGQAQSAYDASLEHYNLGMADVQSGLDAEMASLDASLGLLGERRDASFGEIDRQYGSQREDLLEQANQARGSASVRRARTGMLGTTAASADQRRIDRQETDSLSDLSDWKSTQRRSIEGDYAGNAAQIERYKQDAQRAATGMQANLRQGLVGAEQNLFQQNAAIAQAFPHLMDPMPQFNFELQQAMQTTNWPGLNAMNDPGSPGLITDMFLPSFAGMLGAGLAGSFFGE